MPLPGLNEFGDLPPGRHIATLDEVIARFGVGSSRRHEVSIRLRHIHDLAVATGYLDRLVIFGSYVSNKAAPNDVDVILVMSSDFAMGNCPAVFDAVRSRAGR